MQYVVYETSTGTIRSSGVAPEEMVAIQANAGESTLVITGLVLDTTHYVNIAANPPVVVPLMTITATLTGLDLVGVPMPCTVIIDGISYTVTDGTAELSFGSPGTYTVRVEALHYIPREYEVTVT
jgi:hypothetical protein